jgi:hypothetical protein
MEPTTNSRSFSPATLVPATVSTDTDQHYREQLQHSTCSGLIASVQQFAESICNSDTAATTREGREEEKEFER